jgi:hypothetical protein
VQHLHDYHFAPEELPVKRLRFLILVPVLALFAAAADAQTATLRYRWTRGESRTYRLATETTSNVSGMPEGPRTLTQSMSQVLKFTAEDVAADGTATIRQTFQALRMEGSGPMGKLLVDTAVADPSPDPATRPMRQVLDAMIGESVLIVAAPDGTIRKVDGASRIADKIAQLAVSDSAAGAAGQGIRRMLSEDALKSTLEQTFPKLPAAAVAVGEAWTAQLAMGNEAIGRVTGTSTFTLKALEGAAGVQKARITVGLSLKQEVVPPPSGPTRMVTTLRDNKGDGEILFAVARGHIERTTMRTELTSSVTMNGPDGVPTTMQNKTTTTMTMELVEK